MKSSSFEGLWISTRRNLPTSMVFVKIARCPTGEISIIVKCEFSNLSLIVLLQRKMSAWQACRNF
jgi:hypothetical protein